MLSATPVESELCVGGHSKVSKLTARIRSATRIRPNDLQKKEKKKGKNDKTDNSFRAFSFSEKYEKLIFLLGFFSFAARWPPPLLYL